MIIIKGLEDTNEQLLKGYAMGGEGGGLAQKVYTSDVCSHFPIKLIGPYKCTACAGDFNSLKDSEH